MSRRGTPRWSTLTVALAVALAACGSDPTPARAPGTGKGDAPASSAASATGPDAAPPPSSEPTDPPAPGTSASDAPPSPSGVEGAVDAYLAAANGGDLTSQESGATSECWQKECGSFARQAGKKFRAERRGTIRRREAHALAVADIICDGSRKCDLVYLLFELQPSTRWVVTDVTEDGKKADAWVLPPGYVEPKMPPNQPPGAPPALGLEPQSKPGRPEPKGNLAVGAVSVAGGAVSGAARVLASMRPRFKRCYVLGLMDDAKASGKLELELELEVSGHVERARAKLVSGSLPDSVQACLVATARRAQFDPPEGGHAKIRVPMVFSPVAKGKK